MAAWMPAYQEAALLVTAKSFKDLCHIALRNTNVNVFFLYAEKVLSADFGTMLCHSSTKNKTKQLYWKISMLCATSRFHLHILESCCKRIRSTAAALVPATPLQMPKWLNICSKYKSNALKRTEKQTGCRVVISQ